MSLDQRVIALVDRALFECAFEHRVRALGERDHHDTGGADVEAMHDALALVHTGGGDPVAGGGQAAEHRGAGPAHRRMRGHRGGFVDRDDVRRRNTGSSCPRSRPGCSPAAAAPRAGAPAARRQKSADPTCRPAPRPVRRRRLRRWRPPRCGTVPAVAPARRRRACPPIPRGRASNARLTRAAPPRFSDRTVFMSPLIGFDQPYADPRCRSRSRKPTARPAGWRHPPPTDRRH